MIEDKLNIAVLGDLHGHLDLALSILKKYESVTNTKLDAILQVGDLGYFPDLSRLDDATAKFAKKDPIELGFQDFLNETEVSKRHFEGQETKIDADLVFIAGNHEDQEKLRKLESSAKKAPIPVDFFGKILYLPSGEVYEIKKGNLRLRFSCLGRISGDIKEYNFSHSDLKKVKNLDDIDVFLTHEPDSEEIREVLKRLQPKYHFCGHLHIGRKLDLANNTESYSLDQVGFRKSHKLNDKCIGILSIEKDKRQFKFLEEQWLKEFKKGLSYQKAN